MFANIHIPIAFKLPLRSSSNGFCGMLTLFDTADLEP